MHSSIAVPVAYYFMYKWLENFAYHVGIGQGIFFIAVGISLRDSYYYDQLPGSKSGDGKSGYELEI